MSNNSANSIKIAYEPLRSIAFGSITGTYALIGTLFMNPVRQLIVTSTLNDNVILSYDGVTDHSIIAAASARVLDYGSNHAIQAGVLEQPAQQGVWVRSETINPSDGTLYVEVIYASSR